MTRTTRADRDRLLNLVAREATLAGLIGPDDALQYIPGSKAAGIPYGLYVAHSNGKRSHFTPADGGSIIGTTEAEALRTLKVMFDTLRAVNRKRTQ